MRIERINNSNRNVRDVTERVLLLLLLLSTLLTLVELPYVKFGVHNVSIPLFALMIIGIRLNMIQEVFTRYRGAIIFMGLLYLWMWFSAFQSEFQNTAVKYSIKYSYYPFLFIALLLLTYRNKNNYLYDRLVIYFLLLLGLFGIVEELYPRLAIFHFVRPVESYMPRVSSLMQNPNLFGSIMSLGIIYSILLRKIETINKAEFVVSIVLFTICAFISGSRNAIFVLLVGVIILFAYRKISFGNNKMVWIITAGGCLILLISIYIISQDQSRHIIQHYIHGEGSDRLLIFNAALHEIAHRPITGIGMEVFPKHIVQPIFGRDVHHTHNIILNVLVDLGAVGLILLIFIIYNIYKGVNCRVHEMTIVVIVIFASQMFDYYFHDVTYAAVSFYLMASAANSQYEYH